MSEVEKKSGYLALLRFGERNQSLLNFFNAHGEMILGWMTPGKGSLYPLISHSAWFRLRR